MHTQQSKRESSFSPFGPGLKFESTQPDYNPVDPPSNDGGTGGSSPAAPEEPARSEPPDNSGGTAA